MQKKRQLMLVLMVFLLIAAPGTNAWVPDAFVKTREELPEAVNRLLPGEATYISGLRNAQTYYVLMQEGQARFVYVLMPTENDAYAVDIKSGALPEWNGVPATFGSNSADALFLSDGYGDMFFYYGREADGAWRLGIVEAEEDFGISQIFGLMLYGEDREPRCMLGTMPEYSLAYIDEEPPPVSYEEALASLNSDGYAMVKNDVRTNRVHLRASPTKEAVSYGKYYSGTPVRVHAVENGWAKVDICGVKGYMMMEFLAVGEEMRDVPRYFPQLTLREGYAEVGVGIYSKPKKDAALRVGTVGTVDERGRIYVLANYGEDWLHVVCGNGLSGYMEARYFWEGNG